MKGSDFQPVRGASALKLLRPRNEDEPQRVQKADRGPQLGEPQRAQIFTPFPLDEVSCQIVSKAPSDRQFDGPLFYGAMGGVPPFPILSQRQARRCASLSRRVNLGTLTRWEGRMCRRGTSNSGFRD